MAPAAAGEDTAVSFELIPGALTISVPATANLGQQNVGGGDLQAQLGQVTVTDDRGAAVASWNVGVRATDFTTGSGGEGEVIQSTNATYSRGNTTVTGSGTVPPQAAPVPLRDDADTSVAVMTGVGVNSASWNPLISLTVPTSVAAGAYTATITHSLL